MSWKTNRRTKKRFIPRNSTGVNRAGTTVINIGNVAHNRRRVINHVRNNDVDYYLPAVRVSKKNSKFETVMLHSKMFEDSGNAHEHSKMLCDELKGKHGHLDICEVLPVKVNSKNVDQVAKKYHMEALKPMTILLQDR